MLALKRGKIPQDSNAPTIVIKQEQQQIALSKTEANLSIEQLKERIEEFEEIDRIVDEE